MPALNESVAPAALQVPLVDLTLQHAEVEAEIREGFDSVIGRSAFIGGAEVATFEAEFAAFCEARHCVAVANGTDALEFSLRACSIGSGDDVVLPANTFVATAEAVIRAGATPVLADVDPVCLLIDPTSAARAVTPRTRAIIAVHLYGQMAPIGRLAGLAEAAGAVLIEDAAQAHGARRYGRRAGSAGLAAGFSFYPGKNLGAYGDAGAVLTCDDRLATRLRALRQHGAHTRYEHEAVGFNSRLDTLQAVVLVAKLRRLAAWNHMRSEAADRYSSLLAGVPGVVLPLTMRGNQHVWHLYVVRLPNRDAVLEALAAAGIGAAVHYPAPVHLQRAFRYLGHARGDFPVAEAAADEILSLPLFPHITPRQQEYVASVLADAVRCSGRPAR